MEHKITTENILKAAEKCPQAKETLKTLFPEAFKEENIKIEGNNIMVGDTILVAVYPDKILLNNWKFNWEMESPLNEKPDVKLTPTLK